MKIEGKEMCPYLRIGDENSFIEVACAASYAPKKVGKTILADPTCKKIERGYATENCGQLKNELEINMNSGIILDIAEID